MTDTVRVLCVDDHPLFRDGVIALLKTVAWVEVVGVCGTGEEGVRLVTLNRPDVVLMDLSLPTMTGVEATRQARTASPETRVLVVSMLEDDPSVVAAMRAGASGYLVKGAGQEELLAAIRTVANGGAVFSARVAGRVMGSLTMEHSEPAFPELSEREREVLTLMSDGKDNLEISRELGVSPKTVQNHVSRVLGKLQARDRVEAVLRARDALS